MKMSEIDIFKVLKEAEKRKKIKEKPILVKKVEIKEILPCFTTPGYIRFTAQADRKIAEVIPIIFLMFPPGKTNYSIKENTLILRAFNRMITFFPTGKIAVTNTRDKKEAEEILQKIIDIINDAHEFYLKYGKPNKEVIETAAKLSWMDIYNYLPKTNCGECGYQTCSAFAVSLLQGETKLSKCKPLRGEYSKNLEKLKEKIGEIMLKSLGWE